MYQKLCPNEGPARVTERTSAQNSVSRFAVSEIPLFEALGSAGPARKRMGSVRPLIYGLGLEGLNHQIQALTGMPKASVWTRKQNRTSVYFGPAVYTARPFPAREALPTEGAVVTRKSSRPTTYRVAMDQERAQI